MATPPSSDSPGLLKLEEQLTCSVCLDLYNNPKTLPCLHSFCEACIEQLPQDKEGETYYISCPTCRHRTELPGGGAGAFPVAFTLNNLKDVHSLMKKVSDPQQVTCDNCAKANATGYCKDCNQLLCTECMDMHKKWARFASHKITSLDEVKGSPQAIAPSKQEAPLICPIPSHDEPLKIYCETCDSVICRDCTVRTHKDHDYDLISASYTKHCEELKHSLNPVKKKIEALKKVMSALAEREGEVRERGEGVLEEIHEMVEEMMSILRESERKLSEEAKRVTDAKLEVLSGQAKSAQISLSLLEHIEDYVEQTLKTGTPQQVLSSKKQMMERMSEVATQINVEELHPKEKADFVNKDIKSLHHIKDILAYAPTSLQQCRVKEITRIKQISKGKQVSFSLSIEAPDLSLLSVPISSIHCSLVPVGKGDEPIDTTVTTTSTHPGVYTVHCNPLTNGAHTVKVQVYDMELKDASLALPFNPYLDSITPFRIIPINSPVRLAVNNDGHIIVTEWYRHTVQIFDREGKKLESFRESNVKFSNPRSVPITADNCILVSDDHRIQKISMDGACIASVCVKGNKPLQFDTPDGIAISPVTGHIYVVESGNHRIQVLNPDLTFSFSFGSFGSAIGQFKRPCNAVIDNRGFIYVTDAWNSRVQKFSSDGKFVLEIGSAGSDPGKLSNPVGITIDASGLLCITEWNNSRVSVFTCDGEFIRCFGNNGSGFNEFRGCAGITFDKDGFLYICDHLNNRIVVY